MKTLKLLLLLIAFGVAIYYTESKAQTQWDYLGGIPIEMRSTVDACFYFNFDGDQTGTNELKIVHGDNVGCYITSVTGTPIYAPTHNVNGVDMWSDCDHNTFFNWPSDTAWIMKGNTRLTSGSHVLPFKYNGNIGYFVLKLTTGSDTLKVRGYKFNIAPRDFECYQLIPPINPVRNTDPIDPRSFNDFNNLGQPIDEYYTGLVIRVYEDGRTERTYR